ncbi:alpha/beta hydrolase [Streptomyces nigra]|uniref:alpha/beta hydrolase n=1 Tax=Streptomyces nigra TaxID=1827580 RepID=UPI00341728D4
MVSIRGRLVVAGLSAARRVSRRGLVSAPSGPRADAHRPRWLTRNVTGERDDFEGWPVHTVTPRSGGASGHILFLHGGGYVAQIVPPHWRFVSRLAEATDRTVTVPIYPLAPEHTHSTVMPVLIRLYERLVTRHAPGTTAVMGDSAGAGMGMALLQSLPATVPRPRDLVLLSPWLDAVMDNPVSAKIEPSDPILSVAELRRFAGQYAGEDDPSHPHVSPVNGPLDRLGRVTAFTGTRDVLHPDVRELEVRSHAWNLDLTVHQYPGMFHGWMIMPVRFPEATRAFSQIVSLLHADPPGSAVHGAVTAEEPA